MLFFTGRHHQVQLCDDTSTAVTTPFEDWCSRERRNPDAPGSWVDFEMTVFPSPDGAAPGAA